MTNKLHIDGNTINIEVDIGIKKEDEFFVAYCPSLELSGYGKTEKEAFASFNKEINIFIDETTQRGTLEKYLLKNGWKLQQVPIMKYQPPKTTQLLRRNSKKVVTREVAIPV